MEKARRQKVQDLRLFVKVYVNDTFVTETKQVSVSFPNFEVDIGEQIKIYVLTMPSSIKLEVCAKGFLSSTVIAELRTEVPGENVKTLTSTSSLIKKLDFVTAPHGGFLFVQAAWVGTGPSMPPKILTEADSVLSKQRKIEEEKLLELSKEQRATFISKETLFDVDAPENDWKVILLREHYNKYMQSLLKRDMMLPLYDMEPARFKILKYRNVIPELKDKQVPMLETEVMNQPQFANILKMLRQEREKKEEDKTRAKETANVGTQRKEAFLSTLRQRQQESKSGGTRKLRIPANIIEEMTIDLQFDCMMDFCKAIFTPRRKLKPVRRERVGIKGDTITESKIIIHIVKGHNVPIRQESAVQVKKIQDYERASLVRPDLIASQLQAMQSPQKGQPMRGESTIVMNQPPMATRPTDLRSLNKFAKMPDITRVETYMEVRLVTARGTTVARTQEVEGVHPDWNEIIEMMIQPEKDEFFTDAELTGTKDMLYFSLFDEIKSTEGDMDQETIRKERRFLGSFSIPLLTVFQNPPRLEAMVELNRPLIIFGYYTSVNNLFQFSQEEEVCKHGVNPEVPTFVSISISLDPPIAVPNENEFEYYPGFEDIKLLISGTRWVKDVKSYEMCIKRYIKLFVENAKGESVFVPRYLFPQRPPEAVVDLDTHPGNEVAIESVVRFVSLIPFIADTQAFNDLPDMWCTGQEFLDMGAGDYEEHAVLLCNYFNYIDKKQGRTEYESYLALGKGIPEGSTCYTLRRNKKTNHVEIWNPVSGESYFFGNEIYERSCLCIPCPQGERVGDHDPTCPLKEIGCVISSNNVYVNLQLSGDPSTALFNFENTSYWLPFLSESSREKYFPAGIDSIQEHELTYIDTPPELAHELEQKIQNYIAQEFERARATRAKGRRPMRTRWERDVSENVRMLLSSLEQYKCGVRNGARNSTLKSIGRDKIKEEEDKILKGVRYVSFWGG